jgi:hypothetical protein
VVQRRHFKGRGLYFFLCKKMKVIDCEQVLLNTTEERRVC